MNAHEKSYLEAVIERDKALKRVERLRDALSFYADTKSWGLELGGFKLSTISDDDLENIFKELPMTGVAGKRARQALKEDEEAR